jgi:ribosomal protein S18 acetylase RimI-like enzyme
MTAAPNASHRHLHRPGHPNNESGVVPAHPSEASDLAGLVADAFFALPPSIWLVPAEHAHLRATVMRDYFTIAVEHAFHHGTVETVPNRSAVAVWFDNTTVYPDPENYELRRAAACGRFTERFVFLDDLLHSRHPTRPHHHLAFLAVSPYTQGRGLGTALLRHHLNTLDAAGVPSYLEAASQRLVGVYTKFGYQPGDQLHLAASGPPFTQMWREPPTTAATAAVVVR